VSVFEQLRINALSWLLLASTSALPLLTVWCFRLQDRRLLSAVPPRPVSWSGREILIAVFFCLLFWPAVVVELLRQLSFFAWFYGSLISGDEPSHVREVLWASVLGWPFQVGSILFVLRTMSQTTPAQLGITPYRAAGNAVLGWLSWLVLAPLVLMLYSVVLWVGRDWFQAIPEKHPLLQVMEASPLPSEWFLMIVSAVLLAPLFEELLFRGVLQAWLTSRNWGGTAALAASLAMALYRRLDHNHDAVKAGDWWQTALESAPVIFVLVMIPGCYLAAWLARRWMPAAAAQGIYGTSLLFAVAHANIWPTPIPLFFLGLGLGWLAYRTQSLVAPVTLHVLFNAVACLALVLQQAIPPQEPANGKADTTALQRVVPSETSRTVPGSWLPRRM
jgi:membrane protease YdiL (CAAX protease family)